MVASAAESLLFSTFFLCFAPIAFFSWGLWMLVAPMSYVQFMFGTPATEFSPLFYVEIRINAFIQMTLHLISWIAIRRAVNRVIFISLLAISLACLGSAGVFIQFLQPASPTSRSTSATFGNVLPLLLWIGYALLALLVCTRFYLSKSLHRGTTTAKGVSLLEILFVWILPLCTAAYGLWKLCSPASALEFFYPAFKYQGASYMYGTDLIVVVSRLAGLSAIALAVALAAGLSGADAQTSAQIVGAEVAGALAALVAYADLYALKPVTGVDLVGPVAAFFFLVSIAVAGLSYEYSFWFLGLKCSPLHEPSPLYPSSSFTTAV